jgi:hypothetical protein
MVNTASGPPASTASFSAKSSTDTARIGPSGGVSSPKRLMSAFENGRSQANCLPFTNQVRWLKRAPSVTSGSAVTICSTSSIVAMVGR